MVTAPVIATVPRLFPGETIAVLASGPSLTAADVETCRGRARLIAVKDAFLLAPFAECIYGCDARWWKWRKGLPECAGLKYSIEPGAASCGVEILKNTGDDGLELDPSGLRTGKNSTYQAINVAVHLGASRIVLLGADMGHGPHAPKYFFGNRQGYPQIRSPYLSFIEAFETLVEPLREIGVSVVNCSRVTALETFPRMTLEEALS